jgi:hypothetical protein
MARMYIHVGRGGRMRQVDRKRIEDR